MGFKSLSTDKNNEKIVTKIIKNNQTFSFSRKLHTL